MPKKKKTVRARARKGEGMIRRKGSTYEVRVPAGRDAATGKTLYAYATARTEQEAVLKKAELLLKYGTGKVAVGAGVTLGQWLERYIEAHKSGWENNTYQDYRRHLKTVNRHIGDVRLDQVGVELLEQFFRKLAAPKEEGGEGKAKSTISHVRTLVSSGLDEAVRYGALPRNPVELIKMPKLLDREVGREIDEVELQRILDTLQRTAPRNYATVYFLAALGLRRGEVLGIHKENLVWTPRKPKENLRQAVARSLEALKRGEPNPLLWTVDIRQQIKANHSKKAVGKLKTPAAHRTIPLPDEALFVLAEHLERLEKEYEEGMPDYGWLFPALDGGPQNPWYFWKVWDRVLKAAEITQRTRMHDLRGTFITRIVRQTGNLRLAMLLAGHKDPKMAIKHYHRANQRDAVGVMSPARLLRKIDQAETEGESKEEPLPLAPVG